MNLDDAIRKRILELVEENKTNLTNLCLNSNTWIFFHHDLSDKNA